MRTIFSKSLMALPLAVLAMPGIAHAGAFYLQEQSVKAEGRAFSGEVADQGASSLWWNPASIGGLVGGDSAIGFSAILPSATVANTGSMIVYPGQGPTPIGGVQSIKNPINDGYLPSGSIAYGLNKYVAVGLSLTAPYSFTTDYADGTWVSYAAGKTRLRTYDIQPSIAVVPFDGMSLGVAINVERMVATLSNFLPPLGLAPDGKQTLHGTGWDVGFSVGAQWRHGPLSLGVSYKSSVKHHLDGTFTVEGAPANNGTIAASASFSTPWQATFGARYAVTPQLTLNAEATRFGWSKFDLITLGAPLYQGIPEIYRDTWSFAVGADYALNEKWTVRGGVQRDVTPVNLVRDPRVPDGNRWNFALGASYAMSSALTLDAAANYVAVANSTVSYLTADYPDTIAETDMGLSGTVTGAHVVVLSVGGRLKF